MSRIHEIHVCYLTVTLRDGTKSAKIFRQKFWPRTFRDVWNFRIHAPLGPLFEVTVKFSCALSLTIVSLNII